MPRFDPAEFGRLLASLTPQELRQADARYKSRMVREFKDKRLWEFEDAMRGLDRP